MNRNRIRELWLSIKNTTPGPWSACPCGTCQAIYGPRGHDDIAKAFYKGKDTLRSELIDESEAQANANFMALAREAIPELLLALVEEKHKATELKNDLWDIQDFLFCGHEKGVDKL